MTGNQDTSAIRDFPYYNGRPVLLSATQWAMVLGAVALGFLVLTTHSALFSGRFGPFIPAVLFPAIPLAVLAWVTPSHWTALFRRVGLKDVGWMFFFAALNMVVTLAIGMVVVTTHGAQDNPVFAMMEKEGPAELALFFLQTLPQLLGEEIVTILPLLAVMALLHGRFRLSRKAAMIAAWLATAVLFGALHLPTYGWDFVQCFVVIGSARLVLSLAYLKTKNLWVSTGAHVINDWTFFIFGLLAAAAKS